MPKMQIIKGILIIIILSFICIYIYDNYKVEYKISINVKEINNCSKELKKYYKDKDGNTYYLYCLDDIVIDYVDRVLGLNKALDTKQIDMNYIFDNVKLNNSFNNVSIYKNEKLSLIQCKINNKYNYIFGNTNMEYKEVLCSNIPYICTFTKTYYVIDKSDSQDSNFIYLTLKSDINSEVETVKVEPTYTNNIIENNYYKFIFASNKEILDQDIKEIFKNNNLLSIELLDNSNNQINSEKCD